LSSDNAIVILRFSEIFFPELSGKVLYNEKMTPQTEAAELAKLPEGSLVAVFPSGLPVLLIRRGGEVYALENRCAHMGCPLSAGRLDGWTLQCPCHDWRFDIRDGRFLDAPELRLKSYAVEIKEGKVMVRLT
jgi:nitrite reductase/ring-hydroxylating ferredoxin subunit